MESVTFWANIYYLKKMKHSFKEITVAQIFMNEILMDILIFKFIPWYIEC